MVREDAVHTIEIGLGSGLSALHVCAAPLTVANPAARHVVIDPHPARRFSDLGLQVLADAGVAHLVEHHPQDSALARPRLPAADRRFNAAFVDDNHRFDGVPVDVVHLSRLVRPAGIIFLDDYQLPAVTRAAALFVNNLAWTIEEVSPPLARASCGRRATTSTKVDSSPTLTFGAGSWAVTLTDRERILGADHPDTAATRTALERWRSD